MLSSYDNTVRLFDTRKPLHPVTQADVGGGAWRVKWHPSPSRKSDLLVACMHDGFKILRFGLEGINLKNSCEIIKRYDAHESLAYGVDWSFAIGGSQDIDTLIASCSFYDHALHVWSG
jgi:diphthine methyl ester acylhydrolase